MSLFKNFSYFQATPPPKFDHPPKYDPDIYEDSGKALAIAILDLTESNPWTRLTCSAYKNLRGVRDWLRKYIKAKAEEEAEKAAKQSPKKDNASAKSVRSTARRVRTFSASSVTSSKKKILSTPKSPESYRPVSKFPRKNSATLVPTNSPIRGRKLMPTTTTSNTPTRSASTSGLKRYVDTCYLFLGHERASACSCPLEILFVVVVVVWYFSRFQPKRALELAFGGALWGSL